MMHPTRLALLLVTFTPGWARADGYQSFHQDVQPLVKQYCLGCHSTEKQKGDLDLERFATFESVGKEPKPWQDAIDQLEQGEMPPKDKPQPSAEEKARLLQGVRAMLDAIAHAHAGDPGPVVLRRLSNAEYTYTIRDLTGMTSLDPAKEFPADGAAGEGFTNTGNSLVMSPALFTKYLDAAKGIADHAVLLPDGFRFSPNVSRRDWTNEVLAEIRAFYARFAGSEGGTKVDLQGIKFDTNEGGRLPVEKYLAVTLAEREALANSSKSIAAVADEAKLSPKYLGLLWEALRGDKPSLLLDLVRAKWRAAKPSEATALAAEIATWQSALWRFTSVGHIGKLGGPKAWMEPVTPLTARQEIRLPLKPEADAKEIVVYLSATDAGDGNEHDFVVWERPRLVAPGRPDLPLRAVRAVTRALSARRERLFATTAKCLAAVAEASDAGGSAGVDALAKKHDVEAEALTAWLEYLGVGAEGTRVNVTSHLANKISKSAGYDFVNGWGSNETPNVVANASDQHVRIPGNAKPRGVVMHPSPKLRVAAGWSSPVAGAMRVEGKVQHAHPECGNGVTWALELRRGATRQRLATGWTHGGKVVPVGPVENLAIRKGDLVSLLIGARDGNHSCDLTAVDLTISGEGKEWDLARDVTPDIHQGNPHADAHGNEGVWHFYTEPDGGEIGPVIPAGSVLANWLAASSADKPALAEAMQRLLEGGGAGLAKDSPDVQLYRSLNSLSGPLLRAAVRHSATDLAEAPVSPNEPAIGLDPSLFGRHPRGLAVDAASLCVQAPALLEVRLPASLVEGAELVTAATLHPSDGGEGGAQAAVTTTKPEAGSNLTPTGTKEIVGQGVWTGNHRAVSHAAPILVADGGAARRRWEAGFEEFRQLFPAALCYAKIVPVDEVITLTLFHREDEHLSRLMLDDAQTARLNRMWEELRFISQDALTLVDAYEQLWQYATQDADPKVFEPMREPIQRRAAEFRQRLVSAESRQLDALLEFAGRAYRRPLTADETGQVRQLYGNLRSQELPHDQALRLTLARVLAAPAFLYRLENPPPGEAQGPVTDHELATRLSYFLWSSTPDAALLEAANRGELRQGDRLATEAKRMLADQRVRRLATEFACQWLHIHGFDTLDEKSERHFPTFAGLRGEMYEESIRFFTDLFQRDGSALEILDSDHTFLNEALAKHYGVSGVRGADWRRVDGLRALGRGGVLAQATVLSKQSGASRTSPILRGNWVSEVLLGDKLPRPPKGVPLLPEDEGAENLTVRQLTEHHSSDPKCYGCHRQIDPYGYALEGFDAIGRRRERDLANHPIDTKTKVLDGTELDGLAGLRDYLAKKRRDDFLDQFCRKLLGYALGRSVMLSDRPLLQEMRSKLEANGHRVGVAIESILRSRQFREIRGRDRVGSE